MLKIKEDTVLNQVITYLKYQYPNILYRVDYAAGLKCSKWPDLFIAKPNSNFSGLFLELKADVSQLVTKKGLYKTRHIKEQAEVLDRLYEIGYSACFVYGFDHAKDIIDEYLNNTIGL